MPENPEVEIKGEVASGFESVQKVFKDNWQGIEVGACLSVVHKGQKVVDLWGGYQDPSGTQEWQENTLVNIYSTTKGLASIAVAVLAGEGLLDYEARVIDYWPEFGAQGKQDITVAQLLSHQAGLCGVDKKLSVEDLYDFDSMAGLLAAQKPLWEPGTAAGYHAVTWGYLPGELVKRITGQSLGTYFRNKVAGPLNADCFIGLPDSEMNRVADLIGPNRARIQPENPQALPEIPPFYPIALLNPSIKPYRDACSKEWRKAEIAAANGQGNARGIATIYGAMANGGEINGVRIITKEAIAVATRQEVDEQIDLVTGYPMRRARGFMLNTDGAYGPCRSTFGHAGAGGSLGFADPENNVAFGYAMNQMEADASVIKRSKLLVDAVYSCLR
jgi:CubicO group peptidase (beta-lactamase class C family)